LAQSAHAFHEPDRPVRIEDIAEEELRKGLTNADVTGFVLAQFPNARTSAKLVQWYRNRLRKNEPGVLTEREAKKAKARRER
jgi:hypothetical protein